MRREGKGIGLAGYRGGSEYVQNKLYKIPKERMKIDLKINSKKDRKESKSSK